MPVSSMNHFTILTDDVPRTVRFYGELLGLDDGERPPFTFPGAWLYAAGAPILHVIGGKTREDLRSGVIDHMAFSAHGLRDTVAKLKTRGIDYDLRRLVGRGQWQLFFFDPNGVRIELDFAADEASPD